MKGKGRGERTNTRENNEERETDVVGVSVEQSAVTSLKDLTLCLMLFAKV